MIVRCPDCRAKYEIAADQVPRADFKLRCPRCKAVFSVSFGLEKAAASTGSPDPQAQRQRTPQGIPPAEGSRFREPTLSRETTPLQAPAPSGAGTPSDGAATVSAEGAGDMPRVSSSRPRPRVTDPALARRMARAMISEMVLNRRAERDDALRTGTVLSRFGPAIVAAHEAYRARVASDLAPAPRIFLDAVNEILGEGTPLL